MKIYELSSSDARAEGRRFIEEIKNGTIVKRTLPNTSVLSHMQEKPKVDFFEKAMHKAYE
jgi:hypothetical protein